MQYVGAYLIRGSDRTLETLLDRLEKEKVIERGSPDLYVRVYRKFGVDEADDVRARARTRPVAGGQRIFAFFAPSMTTESQNALLKTFEEPSADAVFFLITPSPEMLLATVRSRVQQLEIGSSATTHTVEAEKFLAAVPEKRLEMIKPLYMHDEAEERDIGAVILFLQALERLVGEETPSPKKSDALAALYRARKFAGDKGSLLKALLEQMSLLMPKL